MENTPRVTMSLAAFERSHGECRVKRYSKEGQQPFTALLFVQKNEETGEPLRDDEGKLACVFVGFAHSLSEVSNMDEDNAYDWLQSHRNEVVVQKVTIDGDENRWVVAKEGLGGRKISFLH